MHTQKQVDKDAYSFEKYAEEERFVSYQAQLAEIMRTKPRSVMEVGVGDQVVGHYLKNNTPIAYTGVDIADDVGADVIAPVTKLPFPDKSFDVSCAFEVLEHLPFDQFQPALKELARVARTHVLISLPHFGPMLSLSLKVPFLARARLAYKIPYPKTHVFNGQHYWEIGKRNYPTSRIRAELERHGRITQDFVPFGSPYHHFFTLEIQSK